jgi:hypothetical protein
MTTVLIFIAGCLISGAGGALLWAFYVGRQQREPPQQEIAFCGVGFNHFFRHAAPEKPLGVKPRTYNSRLLDDVMRYYRGEA